VGVDGRSAYCKSYKRFVRMNSISGGCDTKYGSGGSLGFMVGGACRGVCRMCVRACILPNPVKCINRAASLFPLFSYFLIVDLLYLQLGPSALIIKAGGL